MKTARFVKVAPAVIRWQFGVAKTAFLRLVTQYKTQNGWELLREVGYLIQNLIPGRGFNSEARQTIVVVDEIFPDANADSGSRRLLEIMKILPRLGYRVAFVSETRPSSGTDRENLRNKDIELIPLRDLAAWLSLNKSVVKAAWLCRFQTVLNHSELIRRLAPDVRIFFDTIDLHFLREGRRLKHEGNISADALVDWIKRRELRAVESSDVTIVVSEHERSVLREMISDAEIRIVGNIHSPRQPPIPGLPKRSHLIFVGGTRHLPNRDAIMWLHSEIMPLLIEEIPGLKLMVVGAVSEEEKRIFSSENIEFLGRVQELDPLYDEAVAALAPLRFGAGVKGKIGEAMANGVPVIATSMAIEGMGLTPDESVLLANSPREFATAVVRLFRSPDLWMKIQQGGVSVSQSRYGVAAALQEIEGLLSIKHEMYETHYLDRDILAQVIQRVEDEGVGLGVNKDGLHFDSRRFAITIGYIKSFGLHSGTCVEIGSPSYLSSRVIWSFFPEAVVQHTTSDLRRSRLPFDDGSVDNFLCSEVIEHISDIDYGHATTLDGLFYFLGEVHRVLKVGGKALITTPNASSLFVIEQALRCEPPLMYPWHFREFTMKELAQIVENSGFKIVAHHAEFVWHLWDLEYLTRFLKERGYDTTNRGDDQFLVIEKVLNEPVSAGHDLGLPA